jgi:signal transduction histidine kinase/DNA-binding response OmpR family regulator
VSPEDRRVLSVNRQFETLFNSSASDIVGRQLDEPKGLVDHVFAEPERLRERFASMGQDQTATSSQTYRQVWPQERVLELFSAPVQSEHAVIGRLYGFRDVTQERELDRMKSEFVSQVSHELRTPLTAIKGFTELVLDGDAGDVNDEQAEYLGIVRSNVDRLMALINDLLDISRIESGRVQLKLEQVDVSEIMKLVERTMRPLLDGKNQTLTTEMHSELPRAWADRDRVVQVLTNLVSNAHKYTQADGAIVVRAFCRDQMVRVEVQDHGMGIPPDVIPKLFSRFFRVDSSLPREIGGTGLGLSIVKSIVEMQGGSVTIESTLGKGSTFAFTLPVAKGVGQKVLLVDGEGEIADELVRAGYQVQMAADVAHASVSGSDPPELVVLRVKLGDNGCFEQAHELAEEANRLGIPLLLISQPAGIRPVADGAQLVERVQSVMTREPGARRVLVVEDDASIRRLLSASLMNRGFEVIEAEDGERGLQLADEQHPDLIVLDLHLPGVDGFTVLQRLKRAPSTTSIPVIAVTGNEGLLLGARARVLALGASDFVEKPFRMDALIEEIRTLTGEREHAYADSHTGS